MVSEVEKLLKEFLSSVKIYKEDNVFKSKFDDLALMISSYDDSYDPRTLEQKANELDCECGCTCEDDEDYNDEDDYDDEEDDEETDSELLIDIREGVYTLVDTLEQLVEQTKPIKLVAGELKEFDPLNVLKEASASLQPFAECIHDDFVEIIEKEVKRQVKQRLKEYDRKLSNSIDTIVIDHVDDILKKITEAVDDECDCFEDQLPFFDSYEDYEEDVTERIENAIKKYCKKK